MGVVKLVEGFVVVFFGEIGVGFAGHQKGGEYLVNLFFAVVRFEYFAVVHFE